MSRKCEICQKKPQATFSVSHSHIRTKRWVLPNLQRVKVIIKGKKKHVLVCTSCIKKDTIRKA